MCVSKFKRWLANHWLIIGITPKSLKIIGQEVTDSTKREIAQAISGIEPAVDVAVEYVDVPEYPGNKVIAMHFDGWVWGDKPYWRAGAQACNAS